ncbi:MAG: hypothetical protein ACXVAD_11045 [Syntrophales bacterium]
MAPIKRLFVNRESYSCCRKGIFFLQRLTGACIKKTESRYPFTIADVSFITVSVFTAPGTHRDQGCDEERICSSPYRLYGGPNNRRYPVVSKRCNHFGF